MDILAICDQTNGQRISIRLTAPKSRQQGDSPCRGIAMKHGIEVYSSVISRAAGNHHASGQSSAVSCWPIRISHGHDVARGPFEQNANLGSHGVYRKAFDSRSSQGEKHRTLASSQLSAWRVHASFGPCGRRIPQSCRTRHLTEGRAPRRKPQPRLGPSPHLSQPLHPNLPHPARHRRVPTVAKPRDVVRPRAGP